VSWTVRLADVRPEDLGRVGGKALGCARLLELGLDVPAGFVLTTAACEHSFEAIGLAEPRRALFRAFSEALAEPELERRCSELQSRIRAMVVPATVADELRANARALGALVAVRSSATCEDSQLTAFAGVYHSELDVPPDQALDAVRTCWAQAHSYAALTHAMRNGVDPAAVRVALLVQRMVPATQAGVLFTREPSGANPELAQVAFTRGGGAALMHGDVTGESVTLRRDGDPTTDPLLMGLLEILHPVERALGHAQDIEWAAHNESLWFLQTRPITSIEATDGPPIMWTRELSEERFPMPMSPLGWSSMQGILQVNLTTLRERFGLIARRPESVARLIRHYVYTNERFFAIPGSLRPNPIAHLRFLGSYLGEGLRFLGWLPRALFAKKFGMRWLLYSRIIRAAIFPHAREIVATWDKHLAELLVEMDAFNEVDPRTLSVDKLFAHLRAMEAVAKRYMEPDLAIYVVKMACSWMVEKIGEQTRGSKNAGYLTDLTAGLPDNRTLQMNLEMETLYQGLTGQPGLLEHLQAGRFDELLAEAKGDARAALDRFIELNGHLTTNWDLREPTWGEEPRTILQMLRGYSAGPVRKSFRESDGEKQARRAAVKQETLDALRDAPYMPAFFEELLATLYAFMAIDEAHHFYCSRLYKPTRRMMNECGRRMVEARLIDAAEDVFFLTLDEVEAALRQPSFPLRYKAVATRTSFSRSLGVRPPERFLDQAPTTARGHTALPAHETEGMYRGVGASPGVATGIVRVIEAPDQVSLFQAGEVLVTPSPNPAWTPIYAVAAAMVTSTGSILSHGLVSAREYHLPAVIGISDVTKKLVTGQKVRVDGDQGTVSVELT